MNGNILKICVALTSLSNIVLAIAPSLGGEYIDPNHYVPGSGNFAGTRMISDNFSENMTERITVIGTDDGVEFWTLFGNWVDISAGELSVDFSPKGGPLDLSGIFTAQADGTGEISWTDGNVWTRAKFPPTFCETSNV